jgi:hypothetical protein
MKVSVVELQGILVLAAHTLLQAFLDLLGGECTRIQLVGGNGSVILNYLLQD